ncbi:MAG: 1-acyl-sn-glycerol-3-phosphate acyltransferase [Bacteroidales bacterium]|nr:1-acyl-sn-glycerol-3-phosphate acyltransferase [Bacteroidales bacterium]MDD3201424.1 1-acyl-sn-glycerol-3-phosphate acyltransferase [Bacteroidales bacterium]
MSREKHNIEDSSNLYGLLRYYVDYSYMGAYRKIQFVGRERIPKDAAVLYAPNHCDALMDALAVLSINHERKVFIARADVFKKPLLKKILTFYKILPINRIRDGIRSVLNSEKTIEQALNILDKEVKVCIMPEGTHRAKHSLLPIGKGVARIAYGYYNKMGADKPMYIVPVGLEYGDYFRLRSTLLVQIGEPVNVTAYISSHPERSEHDMMGDIRSLVHDALSKIIVYIEDNEDYDATWEIARLTSGSICKRNLTERLAANKVAISEVERMKAERPEQATVLFEKVTAFISERAKAKVSINAVTSHKSILAIILESLLLLVVTPIYVAAICLSSPILLICGYLCSKIEDRAFLNSVKFGIIHYLWPLFFAAWAIVMFCTLPWYVALTGTILSWFAPMASFDYFEFVRLRASDWRYIFNKKLKSKYHDIMEIFNGIVNPSSEKIDIHTQQNG